MQPLRATVRSLPLLAVAVLGACSQGGDASPASGDRTPPPVTTVDAPGAPRVDALPAPSDPEGKNPSGGVNAPRHRDAPVVVLVSFDGFRHDYPELYETPNFDRVAREGLRADALIPVFPSKTFPAHYTLATGLHAENHGLVGNGFWDPDRREAYSMRDRVAVEEGGWYGGTPLWVLAERQGMVAASFFWVGSEADVQGVRPTWWYAYDGSVTGEDRVDRVLAWIAEPPETRPHIITLYFSDVDGAGHAHGPRAPETAAAVARVDRWLGRLLDGLEALPAGEETYLILASDHGMREYGPEDVIPFDVSDVEGVRVAAVGPYVSLFTGGDRERAVRLRDALRAQVGERAGVWLRADVPERFRYSADPRIGDVVMIARDGGWLLPADEAAGARGGSSHGWDNRLPEMRSIFLARGPGLPAGRRIPAFESVHVYPFVAHVLGLDAPEVDGRLEVLGQWLRSPRPLPRPNLPR